MKYYSKQDARQDLEKHRIINGDDYQKSQLLYILNSIKEKSNDGESELVWLVYTQSGKVMDYIDGLIPFYIDFIVGSLEKLGYVVFVEGRYLHVKWE